MAVQYVNGVVRPACGKATAGPQWEVTHLSLDASGNRAAATRTHAFVAHFLENPLLSEFAPGVVLRGE